MEENGSQGTLVDPWDHFNLEGADAIRWYMTTQSSRGSLQTSIQVELVLCQDVSHSLEHIDSMLIMLLWTRSMEIWNLQVSRPSLDR